MKKLFSYLEKTIPFFLPAFFALGAFTAERPWQSAVVGMLAGWLLLDAMIDSGLTTFERRSSAEFTEDRDW